MWRSTLDAMERAYRDTYKDWAETMLREADRIKDCGYARRQVEELEGELQELQREGRDSDSQRLWKIYGIRNCMDELRVDPSKAMTFTDFCAALDALPETEYHVKAKCV